MTWQDLSDSELRARLRQRGVDDTRVLWWVRCREEEKGIEAISRALKDDP